MLSFSNHQISRITQEQVSTLSRRIDKWLSSDLDHWQEKELSERLSWIGDIIAFGRKHGMSSDMDYALLTRILSRHRSGWRVFVAAEPQCSVLNCEYRHSGAKVRELALLSERSDIGQTARAEGMTA